MSEQDSNLSLVELLDMADERYQSIMIGGHDLSEAEVKRVVQALRLAALVSTLAKDADAN